MKSPQTGDRKNPENQGDWHQPGPPDFVFVVLKIMVAPLLIVTPFSMVMDVPSLHSQAVSESNVTFLKITGLSEHWGHGGSSVPAAPS